MKIFIKERINNLRSSHYFVITNEHNNDKKLITGQMLRDVNFSLLGTQNETIKLSLCFGNPNHVERTIDFDYIINVNEKVQQFEFNNEVLEIEFNYSEYEQKYMIYCPSFMLKK